MNFESSKHPFFIQLNHLIREFIYNEYERCGFNKTETAKNLKIPRASMLFWFKRFHKSGDLRFVLDGHIKQGKKIKDQSTLSEVRKFCALKVPKRKMRDCLQCHENFFAQTEYIRTCNKCRSINNKIARYL